MKIMNSIIKKYVVCLLALVIAFLPNMVVNATEADVADAEPSQVAIVEVQGYSVAGGMLAPGSEVTIDFTLHNTSGSMAAGSVMMSVASGSNMIYPVYGDDNQFYVGTIGAGDTKQVSIPVRVSRYFSQEVVDLTCTIGYQAGATKLQNTSTIVIPSTGGTAVGVKSINVASKAYVGGNSLISLSYENQSDSNILDAKLVIDGNVEENEVALDAVYSNKSYLKDYYVSFKNVGPQEVSISLQYTDGNGNECIQDLGKYTVNVSSSKEIELAEEGQAPEILGIIGKLFCVFIGIVVVLVIVIYAKRH